MEKCLWRWGRAGDILPRMNIRKSLSFFATSVVAAALVSGCGGREPAPAGPDSGDGRPAAPAAPAAEAALKPAAPAAKPDVAKPDADADLSSADGVIAAARRLADSAEFAAAARLLAENLDRFDGLDAEKIAGARSDMKALQREAGDLDYAVRMLSSGSYAELRVATEELSRSGDVGRILLRKIVRTGTNELALAHAARLLARSASPVEAGELVDRLLASLDTPVRDDIARALAMAPDSIPAETYAPLLPLLKEDGDFRGAEFAGILLDAAFGACGGDAAVFDAAVGSDGALEFLRDYATGAIASTNAEARAAVSRHAKAFGILVPGIRGSFYVGQEFQDLAVERIDHAIQYPNRSFPYPDNRQDYISIRWTGKLVARTAGSYRFHFTSDDGNRLFIDGEKVFGFWGNPADLRADVHLEAGLHDIVIEFQQGHGGAFIRCNWAPPGENERPLADDALLCTPVF